MASRWKNRKLVSRIDPEVYQKDRAGFLRGLRSIGRAASLGHDTRHAYLIVENDRVVGVGGCRPTKKLPSGSLDRPPASGPNNPHVFRRTSS